MSTYPTRSLIRNVGLTVFAFVLIFLVTGWVKNLSQELKQKEQEKETAQAARVEARQNPVGGLETRSEKKSRFIDDVRNANTVKELRNIYAFYAPDGSVDNDIKERCKELGCSTQDRNSFIAYRRVCKFGSLPGDDVRIDTIPAGVDWGQAYNVGGRDFESCAEGDHFVKRRDDGVRVVVVDPNNDRTSHHTTVEFGPGPMIMWIKIAPR